MIPEYLYSTFYNQQGEEVRISIRKEGFSGSAKEFSTNNYQLEYYSEEENIFDPIKGSKFSFAIDTVDVDKGGLITYPKQEVIEMNNADFMEFGVIITIDDVIEWRGYLYPEETTEAIGYAIPIRFVCGDVLALIKNFNIPFAANSTIGIFDYIFQNNSTDRSRLQYNKLYDDGDVVLRTAIDWKVIYFSDFYLRPFDAMLGRPVSGNYTDFLASFLNLTNSKLYQKKGVFYIVQTELHINQEDIVFDEYKWDEAADNVEYLSQTTESLQDNSQELLKTQPLVTKMLQLNELSYEFTYSPETSYFQFRISPTIQPAVGAVYKTPDNTEYTVESSFYNFNKSSYYILCTRTSGNTEPPATGSLTKVSGGGDASLTYSESDFVDGIQVIDAIYELPNNSYYIDTIESQSLASFTNTRVLNTEPMIMFYGGYNFIKNGIAINSDGFPNWYKNIQEDADKVSNGQFITSITGWTGYNSSLTWLNSVTIRSIRITTVGADPVYEVSAYLPLSLESGEDYILTGELVSNSLGRSISLIIGSNIPSPTLAMTAQSNITTNNLDYFKLEFTADSNSDYLFLYMDIANSGDIFEIANVRIFKKSELLSLEELMTQERLSYQRYNREVFQISLRGHYDYGDILEFNNHYLYPVSTLYNHQTNSTEGQYISLSKKVFPYWTGERITVQNNGLSNNTIRPSGEAGDVQGLSRQNILGDYFEFYFQVGENPVTLDDFIAIGLVSGTPATGYTGIDYCFYFAPSGSDWIFRIYENGVQKYTNTLTRDDTIIFKIVYNTYKLEYFQDDTLLHTSELAPTFPLQAQFAGEDNVGQYAENTTIYGKSVTK
jgi:hypothetical protein